MPVPSRTPYPEASRALLRDSVLDAMSELLHERDWAKITLADVARRAGVSRQTLYNEFTSRTGLLQAYAVRLADELVEHVQKAVGANEGDAEAALREALVNFFVDTALDPLVRSLHAGEPKLDLLRLITLDSPPLIAHVSERLAGMLRETWIRPTAEQAGVFSRMLVRVAMGYISAPPEPGRDVPADLASVLSPFVAEIVRVHAG
jgi:AcrR family transcriptional regulator